MNSLKTKDLGAIVAFAALTIALGAVSIPVGGAGVPIVLQNMGVLLAAMILGSLRGGLSTTLFVGVGLIGVPNMAGWQPTISAISGPTVGYIVGYIVASFIVGAMASAFFRDSQRRTGARSRWFLITGLIFTGLVGMGIIYLCGSVGLILRFGLDFPAAMATNIPFIAGDAAKAVLAAAITMGVYRAVPHLVPAAARNVKAQ